MTRTQAIIASWRAQRRHGLRTVHMVLLSIIGEMITADTVTVAARARHCPLQTGTLLRDLEKSGHVSGTNPGERPRRRVWSLTRHGAAVLAEACRPDPT